MKFALIHLSKHGQDALAPLRAIAMNSRPGHVLGIAANDAAMSQEISADDWIKLAPYGDFPVTVVLNKKPQRMIQRFNRAQADKMVGAFNGWLAKAGRLFRGASIFDGHPDADPANYPDKRRYGGIMLLDAREDGLWGKPSWNALGKDNLKEGYLIYPSPAWDFPVPTDGSNIIYPDELVSVGLTNTPNIAASAPVTNDADKGGVTTEPDPTNMKNLLAHLGLKDTDTEDTAINCIKGIQSTAATHLAQNSRYKEGFTAIKKACNDAGMSDDDLGTDTVTNSIDATKAAPLLKGKLTDGAAAIARLTVVNTERSKELLDGAIKDGRITEADRPAHQIALNANFDAGRTILNSLTPKLNVKSITLGDRKIDISDASERQRVVNAAVAENMANNGGDWEAAYNSVKADPKFKPVFEAMKKPGAVSDPQNAGK